MTGPLKPDDFPLYAVGADVYRRTASSPLFTAPDMHLAADLAFRLNRDQGAQLMAGSASGSGPTFLGVRVIEHADLPTDFVAIVPPQPSRGGLIGDDYETAKGIVLRERMASPGRLQRIMQIGYNRAHSYIERMEEEGIVSAADVRGQRQILAPAPEESK